MKKTIVLLTLCLFLCSCAEYYASHAAFSQAQSQAIQASSKIIEQEFDSNGKVIRQSIGNPMAAYAATQMQAPVEPGTAFWKTVRDAFWPAAMVLGIFAVKDIAATNKGNSTTVNGNSNLTGNSAGQGIGNPVTTTSVTQPTTVNGSNY